MGWVVRAACGRWLPNSAGAIEIAELRDYLGDEVRDELGGERYLGCISRLFAKLDVDGDG